MRHQYIYYLSTWPFMHYLIMESWPQTWQACLVWCHELSRLPDYGSKCTSEKIFCCLPTSLHHICVTDRCDSETRTWKRYISATLLSALETLLVQMPSTGRYNLQKKVTDTFRSLRYVFYCLIYKFARHILNWFIDCMVTIVLKQDVLYEMYIQGLR